MATVVVRDEKRRKVTAGVKKLASVKTANGRGGSGQIKFGLVLIPLKKKEKTIGHFDALIRGRGSVE